MNRRQLFHLAAAAPMGISPKKPQTEVCEWLCRITGTIDQGQRWIVNIRAVRSAENALWKATPFRGENRIVHFQASQVPEGHETWVFVAPEYCPSKRDGDGWQAMYQVK